MWKEYFINTFSKSLTAQSSGTLVDTQVIRIDSDADFEFNKTTFVATNDRINLRYRDDSVGRYLTKEPMDIKMVAGRNTLPMGLSNSFIPFIWPRPYVISAGTTLSVEMGDFSNAANTLYLAFHGAKIRPGVAPWDRKFRAMVPFVYSFSGGSVSVAANATQNMTIPTDIDAHFVVQKITGIRTGDALVSVNEGARGRDWSNAPIHIDNLCGNGAFPNILLANRFIYKGSVVNFNIQNLLGTTNVINIALVGVKCYE